MSPVAEKMIREVDWTVDWTDERLYRRVSCPVCAICYVSKGFGVRRCVHGGPYSGYVRILDPGEEPPKC